MLRSPLTSISAGQHTVQRRIGVKYEVRFAKGDPETPPTMDEQIALARLAARKLGVPNVESQPTYRVGRNAHTGEAWAYVRGRVRRSLALATLMVMFATGACTRGGDTTQTGSSPTPMLNSSHESPTVKPTQLVATFPKGTAVGSVFSLKVRDVFQADIRRVLPCHVVTFSHRRAYATGCQGRARVDEDVIFVTLNVNNDTDHVVHFDLDHLFATARDGSVYHTVYIGPAFGCQCLTRSRPISPGRGMRGIITFDGRGSMDVVSVSYMASADETLRIDFVGPGEVSVVER